MARENYLAYDFDKNDEILLALLSQYPFVSFEELADGMTGYIAEADMNEDIKSAIQSTCDQQDASFKISVIPPQNWNAQWEASFQPVEINDFCRIRADFHEAVSGYTHDIVINPKMAFGTGHHETTWMMIDAMSKIDFSEKAVFDYGCGTGVLAILAEKLGCRNIDALDIEVESYENTIENAQINHCSHITSLHGELDQVQDKKYDIILANINRHVLLTTANDLYRMTDEGGVLLMSGILDQDVDLVTTTYKEAGFQVKEIKERGNWRCIHYTK